MRWGGVVEGVTDGAAISLVETALVD